MALQIAEFGSSVRVDHSPKGDELIQLPFIGHYLQALNRRSIGKSCPDREVLAVGQLKEIRGNHNRGLCLKPSIMPLYVETWENLYSDFPFVIWEDLSCYI